MLVDLYFVSFGDSIFTVQVLVIIEESFEKAWKIEQEERRELIKKGELKENYEPFTNRTPLVCTEQQMKERSYFLKPNGIGSICNPCGVPCRGKRARITYE